MSWLWTSLSRTLGRRATADSEGLVVPTGSQRGSNQTELATDKPIIEEPGTTRRLQLDGRRERNQAQLATDEPRIQEVHTVACLDVRYLFQARCETNSSAWALDLESQTPIPDYMVPSLESLCDGDNTRGLAERRVRLVILTILADRKRNGHVLTSRDGRENLTRMPASYRCLRFEADTAVQWPGKYYRDKVLFTGLIRYCIRNSRDPYPLFVIDVQRQSRDGLQHTLIYMAMIQHARKASKLPARTVYGASTDGIRWQFLRMNADLTFSSKHLSEHNCQTRGIFSIISGMIDNAAGFPLKFVEPLLPRLIED